MVTSRIRTRLRVLLLLGLIALAILPAGTGYAQSDGQTFVGTNKTVRGKFLAKYWEAYGGGVTQYGLPISEEMQERSATDGKSYTVQYFEKAVFELHTENQPPYDVLFSLLGVFAYHQKYPNGAHNEVPNASSDTRVFPETGKRVGCEFLDYWIRNGGLMQFGFPISDEFTEVSDVDGNAHRVQYFQRTVFVYHGDSPQGNTVLLADLGTHFLRAKYPAQMPSPTPANTAACEPTARGGTITSPVPDAPMRASVGQGHAMKGVVKSSGDCKPIAGARVVYWMAGPDGEYDDAHRGAVLTDQSGAYRFESTYPGRYGGRPTPHIHLYAAAAGHLGVETEYFPPCNATEGTFDLVLAPK